MVPTAKAGRHGSRRRSVVGLLAALALLVAACDGGQDTADPGDDGDADGQVAQGDEQYNWTVQSYSVAGTEPHEIIEQWAERVERMSQGQIAMDVHPGGAIVGYGEMLEALRDGVIDISIPVSSFFEGHDPAFGVWFMAPVFPFETPELTRYLVRQWANEYGGLELGRELYEPFDTYLIGVVPSQNEPIHTNVPLETLEDLQGLRIRAAPGLTSETLEEAGASTVALPGGEIYTALETGVVDAVEFIGFTENYGLGLHEVTSHAQWPGFHSHSALIDFTIHQDTWDGLPEHLQLILEDSLRWLDLKLDQGLSLRDREIMAEMQEDHGIEFSSLSPEDAQRAREIGIEKTEEWAERHGGMSERIVESLFEYLRFVGQME